MVLRFANGMFEPIWNRNHIDHVQITVAEKLGVEHRGSFYDATGALRDMVPNHLFQLLSLIAMEPPIRFDADAVRAEKAKVLGGDPDSRATSEALQQFGARPISAPAGSATAEIEAYRKTDGRQARQHHRDLRRAEADDRQLALGRRAVLSAHRQGARARKRTEIAIKFKQAPFALFRDTPVDALAPNYLVICDPARRRHRAAVQRQGAGPDDRASTASRWSSATRTISRPSRAPATRR